MILQKCRLATVLAAGDNQRKGKKSREREDGVGGSRHSSFIRSLFTLCTIWWIIMGLSNAVPTNLLLLLRVCDICIHSIDHVNTYIHVHMLFIQYSCDCVARIRGDTKMHNCKLDKEK